VYGSVRTVVWQGSVGDRRPYADQILLSQVPRRETLGSPRKLTAGALVDRNLRFHANHKLSLAMQLLAKKPEASAATKAEDEQRNADHPSSENRNRVPTDRPA